MVMRWTFRVKNKLKISLMMFGVMGVVLLVNLKNGYDSVELRKAFVSIYDDRLVVGGYILKMSEQLHGINEILDNQEIQDEEKFSRAEAVLKDIGYLNKLYQGTVLTEKESEYFIHFTSLTNRITQQLENREYWLIRGSIAEALGDLQLLSEIQLTEGEKIMSQTDKLLHLGSLTSQFELAVLIIVGLMIQVLLFASRSNGFNLDKPFSNLN
jgi:hypothetical protein